MQPVNLYDYEKLAQTRMPAEVWGYYQGGSDDEITLRASRRAFEHLWLRPRMLVNIDTIDLRTTVLGIPVSMPMLIAPTAAHGMIHPEGERLTAQAAGALGTVMTLSTDSTRSMEEVGQVAQGPLWFQLYYYRRQEAASLVQRAEAAGYRAIVLTIDAPILGNRERDKLNDFVTYQRTNHPGAFAGNAPHDAPKSTVGDLPYEGRTLTWEVLPWLHSITSLPILVKGILTAEDALLALEGGVSGIIVSNHGGRQLDGSIPAIEALPEIVEAVAGRCEVFVDGGIRRGTDVLKALALGARAVLIGRPVLWGLAVDGQAGVYDALTILRQELELAMMLAGCPSLTAIQPSLVRHSHW